MLLKLEDTDAIASPSRIGVLQRPLTPLEVAIYFGIYADVCRSNDSSFNERRATLSPQLRPASATSAPTMSRTAASAAAGPGWPTIHSTPVPDQQHQRPTQSMRPVVGAGFAPGTLGRQAPQAGVGGGGGGGGFGDARVPERPAHMSTIAFPMQNMLHALMPEPPAGSSSGGGGGGRGFSTEAPEEPTLLGDAPVRLSSAALAQLNAEQGDRVAIYNPTNAMADPRVLAAASAGIDGGGDSIGVGGGQWQH